MARLVRVVVGFAMRKIWKIGKWLGLLYVALRIMRDLLTIPDDLEVIRELATKADPYVDPFLASDSLIWGAVGFLFVGFLAVDVGPFARAKWEQWRGKDLDKLADLLRQGADLVATRVTNEDDWIQWQRDFDLWRGELFLTIENKFSKRDDNKMRSIGGLTEKPYKNNYNDMHNILLNILDIYLGRLHTFIEEQEKKHGSR